MKFDSEQLREELAEMLEVAIEDGLDDLRDLDVLLDSIICLFETEFKNNGKT